MSTRLRALFIGAPEELIQIAREKVPDLEILKCESVSAFDGLIAKLQARVGSIGSPFVFIGPAAAEISPAIAFQEIRSKCKIKNVYFVTEHAGGFVSNSYVKDGYLDAFLWPDDKERFTLGLCEQIALEAEHLTYSAVRLVDIEAGTKIDFKIAIFLQANKKYVVYANAGDTLEVERLSRLKQHKQNSIYVPISEISAFHRYSAKRLKELCQSSRNDSAVAAKLSDSIYELSTSWLNSTYSKHLGRGREIDNHARKIVEGFVLLNEPFSWCARLIQDLGPAIEKDEHATSVATFAALFSILLGKGRPDDLYAAGLLHDYGLSLLPPAILTKQYDQMTPDEQKVYRRHTQLGVDAIRAKKFSITDTALKAIAQHHEKWEGSGYPSGFATKQISTEGQILALADRFNYLTSAVGGAPLSPDQALKKLERERAIDPDILRTLRLIFEREQRAAS